LIDFERPWRHWNGDLIHSKTIPEGRFIGIPIVCFKHRRMGNPIFLTLQSVGKYKLYLSRQRNIRVDPFGDKEN
jgi:hypothetical protein